MAGLSDLIASTTQKTTELPGWFSGAQQTAAQGAQAGAALGLAPAQTVGQSAVSQFGPNSPFTSAQGYLSDIAQGASNPWLRDSAGNVTGGDPNSALGGLFEAQKQYFNQVLPEIDAQSTAAAIGTGNFGSLRGLTAANKARADALAKMNADQYKSALEAQTQGIQASAALGNVGTQNVENALKTAQWQQVAPIAPYSALANTLGALKTGSSELNKTNLSPLTQLNVLSKLIDSPGASSVLEKFGIKGANMGDKLGSLYDKLLGGGGIGGAIRGGAARNTIPLADGGKMELLPNGQKLITDADGNVSLFNADGSKDLGSQAALEAANIVPSGDYSDLSGGNTDWIDNEDWSSYYEPSGSDTYGVGADYGDYSTDYGDYGWGEP